MNRTCIAAQVVAGRIIAYDVKEKRLVALPLKAAATALPPADFARVSKSLPSLPATGANR